MKITSDLSKLKVSTTQNLQPPRYTRRNNLADKTTATQREVSVEFIQALNNSLGHTSTNTLQANNNQRRISPGRLPTNSQKAKSPGRDTCRHIPPREQINFELASHRANSGIPIKSNDENISNYQKAIDKMVESTGGTGDGSTTIGRATLGVTAAHKNLNKDPSPVSIGAPIGASGNGSDDGWQGGSRIINFGAQAPRADISKKSNQAMFSTSSASRTNRRARATRHIPLECARILDAPGMRSDYYINPLDWSVSENVLAVALSDTVYLWNANNGDTEELDVSSICNADSEQYISALKFIKGANGGTTLAIGVSTSDIYLFDIKKGKRLRKMAGHVDVVNALDWSKHLLSSSCKDGSIFNHDVRQRDHHIGSFLKHTAAVPGLAWSPSETYLASGSNDNLAMVWDIRKHSQMDCNTPLHILNSHIACVKAVAWSPRQQNVLATGGGTADRNIKIWNTIAGHESLSIDTNSQVCSIIFSQNYDEIISSHGYQMNQLSVWQYPSGKKIVDLFGHEERVLHTCVSPDGSTVCSGSEDETLRFWKVFERNEEGKDGKGAQARVGTKSVNKLNSMPRMR